jgi:predicted RNA-binding protein YlxR (DUF448 family)
VSSEPVRSCIGCRARRPISALVRITHGAEGIVVDGPSAGRGAWLCRAPNGVSAPCLDEALRRRAFARAWRVEVDAAELVAIRAALGADRERGAGRPPNV